MSEQPDYMKITIDLAQDAAIYAVGLLAKNQKILPPIPPEMMGAAFLASLSICVIDAMPLEDRVSVKNNLIELINGYEVA